MAENEFPVQPLLQQAKDVLPEITVTDYEFPAASPAAAAAATTTSTAVTAEVSQEPVDVVPADEDAEIIRQVEHYFSEENLPHDAHLLGMIKEGEGTVSFNELCGFKAMRKFKPRTKVREALKRSTLVEFENTKRLRRKVPLRTPLSVTPCRRDGRTNKPVPDDKPWLTKNMMKPTGFEEDHVDEVDPNSTEYRPDEDFTSRIELAITRYCACRKMHQDTRKVFEKFLIFGGFRGGQGQFVGGQDVKAMEGLTKKEQAEMTQYHNVSDMVRDGLAEDIDRGDWFIDFEVLAKAFLSSYFPVFFAWYDIDTVKNTTKVLRNFYRYILLHKVCPEYAHQIYAAIKVCDVAEEELPRLREVDRNLPGGFNVACSMLFDGHHANQLYQGDWAQCDEGRNYNEEEAMMVFKTHVYTHGTKEQLFAMTQVKGPTLPFEVRSTEQLGLEIIAVEKPSDEATKVYEHFQTKDNNSTIIKPMGKLRCKEWANPTAPPTDRPGFAKHMHTDKEYDFLLETSTLQYCSPGMKISATIKKLDIGIMWMDYLEITYASFFTWIANEVIRDYKPPGPPAAWMERQNAKKNLNGSMEEEDDSGGDSGMEMAMERFVDDDELD